MFNHLLMSNREESYADRQTDQILSHGEWTSLLTFKSNTQTEYAASKFWT